MLCACSSGEQFKFEEPPQSPDSLATRDFSASGLSSRTTGEWESKFDETQVEQAESTLKEALSLNYEVRWQCQVPMHFDYFFLLVFFLGYLVHVLLEKLLYGPQLTDDSTNLLLEKKYLSATNFIL